MSRSSLILLPNTGINDTSTGDPVRCDLVQGFGARLYTVAVHVSNFTGQVHIEASLAEEPTDSDWFPAIDPFVFSPLDAPGLPTTGVTGAVGATFRGNYAWLRARMEHLPSMDQSLPWTSGYVDRVLLNQ